MDDSIQVGIALSVACGFNAYIPLLLLALASRISDSVDLAEPYHVIESILWIIVLQTLLTAEIVVDKIPGLDRLNDVVQAFVRPAAGAFVFLAVSDRATIDPLLAAALGFMAAAATHAYKAYMRPVITLKSRGLANPVVSLWEDAAALVIGLSAIVQPVLGVASAVIGLVAVDKIYAWAKRFQSSSSVFLGDQSSEYAEMDSSNKVPKASEASAPTEAESSAEVPPRSERRSVNTPPSLGHEDRERVDLEGNAGAKATKTPRTNPQTSGASNQVNVASTSVEEAGNRVSVFIAYAHVDARFERSLRAHLSPLVRRGIISTWYDGRLVAGQEWETEIERNLQNAQMILLLVSPDFYNSEFCYSREMKSAIERHERGEAVVIPIVIRPVHWHGEYIEKLQMLPYEARPVSRWSNRDSAWLSVVSGIEEALRHLQRANSR